MATVHTRRLTIIGTVGLLGASAGLVLGLIEAACLRLGYLPLYFYKPVVPHLFWYFAPLLTSLTFCLLGLLAGFLASLSTNRFVGKLIITTLVGLAAAYVSLVMRFSLVGAGWYIALRPYLTPQVMFFVAFGWTLPALWDTRLPNTPLGCLARIPQRLWLGIVLPAIAALALAVSLSFLPDHLFEDTVRATHTPRSPNIVLIMWDTTRADHLSSYGYFRSTTPNVDQFAKRGVLFENAISSSSWTLPSVASIFTSLLPHQHGAESQWPFGSGPRTLAEVLDSRGYETAGFNGNPYFGLAPWGLGRGFENYRDSTKTLGYSLDATRVGGEFIEPLSERWFGHHRINQFTGEQLNKQVYHWFEQRSDRPFFLFINYNDAHEPYDVPHPYDKLYGQPSQDAKVLLHTAPSARFYLPGGEREGVIASYDGALSYIDSQVGELIRFLERSPEWSNTYVIITADHGESFGEHGTYTHGWDLYRETLHVPLIIVGPGIPQGVRVAHMARTRQIFATALEMAGMKHAVLQRNSLARMWRAGYRPTDEEEPAVSEVVDAAVLPAPQGMISLTTREWHFIYRAGHQRSELYHWTTDPAEEQNLADLPENQVLVESLKAKLISLVKRSYRPWRDTRYLLAFSKTDFAPDMEALNTVPTRPGGPWLPRGAGAPQTLFLPKPAETTMPAGQPPDVELLKSLPYDGP